MADKDIEKPTEQAKTETPVTAETKPVEAKSDLPVVESPPLSPATETATAAEIYGPPAPVAEAAPPREPLPEPPVFAPLEDSATILRPRFGLSRRMQRNGLLAASVVLAAGLGAIIGALATGPATPPVDVAAVQERQAAVHEREAMQQTLKRLSAEVATLKGNIESSSKTASTQLAKLNERLNERLKREAADITASIAPPQAVAATPVNLPVSVPLPQPRPTQRQFTEQHRIPLIDNWTIYEVRNGYVYVQGFGDIYQVTPGAPLPGLGRVESIRRQDGRWLVVTPKGFIVAKADRRYFETY